MDQAKRKLSFNHLSEEKIKKLRLELDQSITSIENFSNELFYEIFDYLDSCDIYEGFSNLTFRFQQLLNSSSFLFKINYKSPIENNIFIKNLKQIIRFNRQQIFSVDFWMPLYTNELFSSFTIDLSLNHLQSLVLYYLEPDILISFLVKLIALPCLLSLKIYTLNYLIHVTDIHRIVFTLPKLKYYKSVTVRPKSSVLLPIASNQQLTSIEHLVLSYQCTFEELFAIISYTPQLRRLSLKDMRDSNPNIEIISPTALSNLTHFQIYLYDLRFDIFEIFIRKINFKLKVLRVIVSKNRPFFDAYQWKQFILQYFPQLKIFYFKYSEFIDHDFIFPTYPREVNQFISSFWIERYWIFEIEINGKDMLYLVRPYRKRWYQHIQDELFNSFIEFFKFTRLIVTCMTYEEYDKVLSILDKLISTVAQIYHLEVLKKKIFYDELIDTIILLPEFHTMKIHSLSLCHSRHSSFEELRRFSQIETTCYITKVYLEVMDKIENVYFIMKLCPYMEYLKVDSINDMDIEVFLRHIFNKINHDHNEYLHLLCFHVSGADDQVIKTLEIMINVEKLLIEYTIKCILENIYLQLK